MTPEQHDLIANIFGTACTLPHADREAFVSEATPDEEVRAEVHRLLDHDARPHELLEKSQAARGIALDALADASRTHDATSSDDDHELPTHVGEYEIVALLGTGGMGTVYKARQVSPARTVALKVIRTGIHSHQVTKRFAHEAQVLGQLQHPAIAQVYEAGTFDAHGTQRPFFAMEFIDGVPIDDYARAAQLSTAERVELLARVADGVQHAHNKGIIHRDLKPPNILVVDHDATTEAPDSTAGASSSHTGTQQGFPTLGQPKILDFGVARMTDSDIQITTTQTDASLLIGTVPYMSPEQAAGVSAEIDTRSDVYALGLVLYELLSGRLPYAIRDRMMHEALRVIREDEPTRLGTFNRACRGDLETIVRKALEKDKSRRYQTVAQFSADLRRYLNDEPIVARRGSAMYQLSKFARRNRGAVFGAVATATALLLGLCATTYMALVATRARDDAAREASTARQINSFLEDMLTSADPRSGDRDIRVVDVLDDAVLRLEDSLEDQPEIAAELCMTIGSVYLGLGKYREAEPVFRRMLALRLALYGPDDERIGGALSNIAVCLRRRGELTEAASYYEQALENLRKTPDTVDRMVVVLHNLTTVHNALGQYDVAERWARDSVSTHRALFGNFDYRVAIALNGLSKALHGQDRLEEAEPLIAECVEIMRTERGPEHPMTATAMSGLGAVYADRGKYAEAVDIYRKSLDILRDSYGDKHPFSLSVQCSLAVVLDSAGDHAAALAMLTEAVAYERAERGDASLDLAHALMELSEVQLNGAAHGAAVLSATEAFSIARHLVGPDHPLTRDAAAMLVTLDAPIPPAADGD